MAIYRFSGRYTDKFVSTFANGDTDWRYGTTLSVLAETKDEADAKALDLLGGHTTIGMAWVIEWNSIYEVDAPVCDGPCC